MNDFISDLDEDECEDDSYSSSDTFTTVPKINGKPLGTSSGDPFLRYSYQSDVPSLMSKTNGATNGAALKLAEDLVSKIVGGNGFAKFKVRYIQDEARAGIEAWQTDRIALWHSSGGGSVQWFSVFCYDRNSNLLHLAPQAFAMDKSGPLPFLTVNLTIVFVKIDTYVGRSSL